MKAIDEAKLETDLDYRYQYLAEFMDFTREDVAAIHALAPKLVPKVASIVDATYEKLLSYDATRRHFVPRQHGYDGALPKSAAELSAEDGQIQFRKEHLRRYLMNVVGNSYDARMVKYLDVVGKMHTPLAGNPKINVPLVQMNALMGLLADALIRTIQALGLDRERETRTISAINKLLWIQNDLITRHYADPTRVASSGGPT